VDAGVIDVVVDDVDVVVCVVGVCNEMVTEPGETF